MLQLFGSSLLLLISQKQKWTDGPGWCLRDSDKCHCLDSRRFLSGLILSFFAHLPLIHPLQSHDGNLCVKMLYSWPPSPRDHPPQSLPLQSWDYTCRLLTPTLYVSTGEQGQVKVKVILTQQALHLLSKVPSLTLSFFI